MVYAALLRRDPARKMFTDPGLLNLPPRGMGST